MTLLTKNIAANFAGSSLQVLMGLVFIPLYIKFLGIEAYGLIGILASLQALFSLLDMGLGATVNREMARLSVLPDKAQEMRNLVRTLEVIYWGIAAMIGIVVITLAPFLSNYWVKPGHLSPQTIEQAVRVMGFAIALQWPVGFYSGGLMGLQRHVLLNGINIGLWTFRGAGAVFVIWVISPTIYAFFAWQIIVSATNVILAAFFLWQSVPSANRNATIQWQLLRGIWRFAASMSGITILAVILTQLDKIILSKMLSLEMFGYYSLASMVSMTIYRVIGPVFSAVYPRLTQLASLNDQEGLKLLYHKSCQFMSVLILPATFMVVFFSYELLLLWTQNPITAKNSHLLGSILIVGTALNGIMNLPHALQLAHGWTRLALYTNLFSVIVLVPLIIFMTTKYGAVGGASVWVILNGGYFLIAIQFMHLRLLRSEKWRWYWQDVGLPFLAALSITGLGRLLMSAQMSQGIRLSYLSMVAFLTLIVTVITTPTTRIWFFNRLSKIKVALGV